ncbi:MAG: cyclic nucleotide-binding protein, partial [Mesorhizobium sp.]
MNKTVPELANRWLRLRPENLSELERRVLQSAVDRKPVSQNINDSLAGLQNAGDRIADAIARVGGSWTFILSFIAFLTLWIG